MVSLVSPVLPVGSVDKLGIRIALITVTTAFYALTFLSLHAALDPGVVSLSVVPVGSPGGCSACGRACSWEPWRSPVIRCSSVWKKRRSSMR
jgi:hypothetical protein